MRAHLTKVPGQGGAGPQRKVVTRDVPHTEDVTGRVDTNRLTAASAANKPPVDDPPPDEPPAPVVRRLVTRPPKQ